jgi:hypothetical protein
MDEKWKYRGGAADSGCVAKGLPNPADDLLLDWRDIDALGREMSRLQALWRQGLLTARALRAGIWALDRMIQARQRGMDERLVEIEALLERLQAQVAVQPTYTPPPPRRLLS